MATREFKLYRLHFTTPLHISNSRADYGVSLRSVLSDTMYAALTATLAKMGDVPKDGNLGCVISGLFPYCKTSDKVDYYFPKPLSTRLSRNLDNDVRKAMKKQTWLKQSLFEQVLQGQELSEKQEIPEIIHAEESARVNVSRTGENAEPFYMERLYFTENTGLYFLVKGDDTTLVDKALSLLALEGIGTDRNVGNGAFVYKKDSIIINVPDNTEYAVSLSTFIPDSKEQLSKALGVHAAYELIRRGGWITDAEGQGLRKNAVYALAAGSVLAGIKTGDGAIVNLAPKGVYTQHPVWRCGKTICLPIKL